MISEPAPTRSMNKAVLRAVSDTLVLKSFFIAVDEIGRKIT